jgi:hypothetical protein
MRHSRTMHRRRGGDAVRALEHGGDGLRARADLFRAIHGRRRELVRQGDIDDRGDTHAVWGEGLNYQTPRSIWYTRGR